MKHRPEQTTTEAYITRLLEAHGIPCQEHQARVLAAHARAVLDARATRNLTAIDTLERALVLHVEDSAVGLPLLIDAPEGAIVDMGSGAGYPGIPLAVLSNRPVTLVDGVRKKVEFLERVVRNLGVNAEAIWARVERLAVERAEAYAVVVARAVADLPTLVEWAAPFLRVGGVFIAYKGRLDDAEAARGRAAAAVCGLEVDLVREERLSTGERRALVRYVRVGPPTVPLPRREGLAKKRPLA